MISLPRLAKYTFASLFTAVCFTSGWDLAKFLELVRNKESALTVYKCGNGDLNGPESVCAKVEKTLLLCYWTDLVQDAQNK